MDINYTIILIAGNEPSRSLVRQFIEKEGEPQYFYEVDNGRQLMNYLYREGEFVDPRISPRPDLILLNQELTKKERVLNEMQADLRWRNIPLALFSVLQTKEGDIPILKPPPHSYIELTCAYDVILKSREFSLRPVSRQMSQPSFNFPVKRLPLNYPVTTLPPRPPFDSTYPNIMPCLIHYIPPHAPYRDRYYSDLLFPENMKSLPSDSAIGDTSKKSVPSSSPHNTEAFAIARIKDIEDNTPLHLATEYKLQTGISHERPSGFTIQKFALPSVEEIELDIIIHAPAFSISPQRHQRLQFLRGSDSKLLEFMLVPKETGKQRIEVRFYYQRNWLTAVILDVTVVELILGEEE